MAAAIPFIMSQWLDDNGKPLAGGKLYTYKAGTSELIASFTDSTGLVPNTNPVVLDSAGRANVWLAPGSYKLVMMNSKDQTLWTVDKVKPADGGGGGIVDSDYTFDGFSARFNEQFGPTTGLMDTLSKIIKITYTAPGISLSASGSGTIREKGTAVTSSTLTASITKKSDPIASLKYYFNGTLIYTDPSPPTGGGTGSYNWSGSFSDNSTFRADATDNGATGGPTTVSASSSFTFVYPYLYGAGLAGKNGSQIYGLTKALITSTATVTETISAADGWVFYFAFPASYGSLTSILDVNGFETISSWTVSTKSIVGLDGTSQSYRCYEFNNPVVAGSYQYTFKR